MPAWSVPLTMFARRVSIFSCVMVEYPNSAATVGSTVAAIALELNQVYNSLRMITENNSASPDRNAGFGPRKGPLRSGDAP